MASTGSLLRELREQRGVSLEELARATRIGHPFLEALEADDFGALPPGPFAKGFIRAYCQALEERPDEALALYSLTTEAPAGSRDASSPMPRHAPRRSRTPVLVSLGLLVGLGLALAAVTLALRPSRDDGVARPAERRSNAGSTVPYTAEAGVPAPVAESRPPAPGEAAPTGSPAPPSAPSPRTPLVPKASPPAAVTPRAAKGKSYRLVARASQSTWIRVRLDGGRTVEETLPAGAVREWISSRPFELRIANAGGLTLELNGRVLPPLGARGTTVHRLVLPTDPR